MRVTLLSNGYGEDTVGALLAEKLVQLAPHVSVRAFPTVDVGRAYERLGIPILGPRRVMPSGGLTLHTPRALLGDLRAGFLGMTASQVRALRGLETDLLLVVGDLYALLLSGLVRTRARFYVQTLVSVHHASGGGTRLNRLFMERFTAPERLLMRRLVRHSYVRDAPTARYLQRFGLPVSALGNPMLGALGEGEALTELHLSPPVVALLPGTRRYAAASLQKMLAALLHWPAATGLVAWAGEALPELGGWRAAPLDVLPGWELVHGQRRVYALQGRFASVLRSAHLALGTSGTAHEQAAALGLPVVAFPHPPLYTRAFLRNQKRLLADALTLSSPHPGEIARTLRALWEDPARFGRASHAGRARMGEPGGAEAIVRDLLRRAPQR